MVDVTSRHLTEIARLLDGGELRTKVGVVLPLADAREVKVTKDMLDLARHIVNQKAGQFEPQKLEDHYETALIELINQKRAGQPITPKEARGAKTSST